MSLTVILPLVLTVLASISAYLIARRQTSGSIGSTTADRLWEEGGRFRNELREEIERLNVRIVQLEEQVRVLLAENQRLREAAHDSGR